jgi:broad specificity phosphatase PhoE
LPESSNQITTLGLLRHGQTDWNIDYRLQGVTDIPLNATGIQQAQAAARALAEQQWDVLLSSPLTRALETAKIVATAHAWPEESIQIDDLLLERSFGEAEGMIHADWKATFGDRHVPGSESRAELNQRTRALLDAIAVQFAGKRVLAVSHGALIREVLGIVSDGAVPPAGERISNACLNTFVHEVASGWQLLEYAPHPLG